MKNKERTEMTATNNTTNALVGNTLDAFKASSFGYYEKEFTTNDDGMTAITVRNSDGSLAEKFEKIDDESMNSTKALEKLRLANGVVSLAVCYYASTLDTVAENTGFRSIGDYVSANLDGYKPVTVNQYARVGKYYLEKDSNGDIVFKREWLKGVSITNLVQSLALLKACDNDIDKFYNEYIASGKLHLLKPLTKLKEEIQSINGKDSKDSKDSKASKPATVTPLTALAMVREWCLGHEIACKMSALFEAFDAVESMMKRAEEKEQ